MENPPFKFKYLFHNFHCASSAIGEGNHSDVDATEWLVASHTIDVHILDASHIALSNNALDSGWNIA